MYLYHSVPILDAKTIAITLWYTSSIKESQGNVTFVNATEVQREESTRSDHKILFRFTSFYSRQYPSSLYYLFVHVAAHVFCKWIEVNYYKCIYTTHSFILRA